MFTYDLQVRGYELDSYGHVNNAVYLNYMEQARWALFRETGILDLCINNEWLMVVADIHIRYSREALLFDPLTVHTSLSFEEPYVIFRHHIINNNSSEKITRAVVKTLVIDKNRTPCGIPAELTAAFQKYLHSDTESHE